MNRDAFNTSILHGIFAGVALYAASALTADASVTHDPLRLAKPTANVVGEAQATAGALRYAKPLASLFGDAYLTDSPLRFANSQAVVLSAADTTIHATLNAYPTASLFGEAQVVATGVQIAQASVEPSVVEAQFTATGERLPYAHPATMYARAEIYTDMARINTFRVNFVYTKSYLNGAAAVRAIANEWMGATDLSVSGELTASAFVRAAAESSGSAEAELFAAADRNARAQAALAGESGLLAIPNYTHSGVTYRGEYATFDATAELAHTPVRYAYPQGLPLESEIVFAADAFNRKAAGTQMEIEGTFLPYLIPARAAFVDMYAEVTGTAEALRTAQVECEMAADAAVGFDALRLAKPSTDAVVTADFGAQAVRVKPARTEMQLFGVMHGDGTYVTARKTVRPTHVVMGEAITAAEGTPWVMAQSNVVATDAQASFAPTRLAMALPMTMDGGAVSYATAYALRSGGTLISV
ncbi:MAG: hypothetical protein IE913_01350, partial [Halothiobacillus sp.]|nr:hypothetical protein [Halothiobacillus sp.]